MSDDKRRPRGGAARYLNGGSNALMRRPPQRGDEQNDAWTREQLLRMDDCFVLAVEAAIRRAPSSDVAREIRHQQADLASLTS